MMRMILVLLLGAGLLAGCERKEEAVRPPGAPAGTVEDLPSEPGGFRDVSWGEGPAAVAGLEEEIAAAETGEEDRELVFTRRGEKLSLAGVALGKVEYRFRAGRFVRAIIYPEGGEAGALALKAALFERYGAVGPAVGSGPAGLPAGGPFKEYRWAFGTGSVAFYLDTTGGGSLLVFAAADPAVAKPR
jgi:hypothetical protein